MIEYENHLGRIDLSDDYFYDLVSQAVVSCFGVVAMSNRGKKKLDFGKRAPHKGIAMTIEPDGMKIDLHLVVMYGVNIQTIAESIVHAVTYQVESATSLKVKGVNVYIDDVVNEENE